LPLTIIKHRSMKYIFFFFIYLFIAPNISNAQQSRNKSPRIIHFSGMDWYVRNSYGNPANNYWSDHKKSVWVDSKNRLHLKIRKVRGKWYCAEIRSVHPTTYGKHRFFISSKIDELNENVVGAAFIYKNTLHEMDVEFSRWKHKDAPNSQYVVQPEKNTNMHKFNMSMNGDFSTHIIDWQANKISFKSFYGHKIALPDKSYLINDWQYAQKKLIDDGSYRIHINLWLVDHLPPTDNKEAEIIVSSLDTPISPIEITGNSNKNISLYPNHYYDNIFVYHHQYAHIHYKLINSKNEILIEKTIKRRYFFINLINETIGTYKLEIKTKFGIYNYQIIKHY